MPSNMFKPPVIFFLTVLRRWFFCGSFLLFVFRVFHTVLSVHCSFVVAVMWLQSCGCSLVVTCCERADLLALLCVICSCVCVAFPYGVVDNVWYLIVSIPDLCLLHCLEGSGECIRVFIYHALV